VEEVAESLSAILAIEILAACRGLDLRRPRRPGRGVAAAYDVVRERVPERAEDRPLAPEIVAVRALVDGPELLAEAEEAAGPLVGIL
jgi:histidine ammonia-lyase